MLGNFFDISGQGQRVDVTIGDQPQQRQIGGDASGIGGPCYRFQRLRWKLEPLLLEGLRPQPPGTEIARDHGPNSIARCAPLRRDTGVQSSDFFDALRIAPGSSGSCIYLRNEGFGFRSSGAGLHDGAIGYRSCDPLPEGAVARDIDWDSRPSWRETQSPLMELDDLAVKVDALAP